MTQTDGSIYLQQQAPDILGNVVKGMQMSNLVTQGQEQNLALQSQKQSLSDQQAVRDALKSNVVSNPDGTTSINQAGVLSDLAKTAPTQALDYQQRFAEQNAAQHAAQLKQSMDKADLIARHAGAASDQASYSQSLSDLSKAGIDTSQMPAQYDPNLVKSYQLQALSAKDQLAYQQKLVDQKLQQQKIGLESQKNQLMAQQQGNNKQGQAMQQTMGLLSSARGDPAVAQAEKDIYATQKANSLVDLYGDPDKLSQKQVNLLAQEVGKIASGGTPSMHELDGITPGTLQGSLSDAWSKLSNSPTKANAGEFVKQYQDYANTVSQDAKKVIQDKYGRVIESNKRRLNPDDYNALQQNYVNRFSNGNQPTASKSPHDMSDAELEQAYKAAGGK